MAHSYWDMVTCPQGAVAVVARGGRLCRVCFESSPERAAAAVMALHPDAVQRREPLVDKALAQLTEYFQGQRLAFDLPLDDGGLSPFTRRVRHELMQVPCGGLVSYAALAERAGSPRAARAVGRAMATNPLPLIVPCHRVVNADGRIGHYSAAHGSRTKGWLIDFERELAGA